MGSTIKCRNAVRMSTSANASRLCTTHSRFLAKILTEADVEFAVVERRREVVMQTTTRKRDY